MSHDQSPRAGDGNADALAQALEDAATSLETIAKNAGNVYDTDGYENLLEHHDQVRGYAASRAGAARAALAAAPAAPSVPASFPAAIWQLLLTVADRKGTEYTGPWEGPNGEPMQDDADAAIAWIKAQAAAPAAAPAWQPIETAPKDGRKLILAYRNRAGKARTVLARWLTDEEAAETDADGVGLEGGWYESIDNWGEYTEVTITEGEPSHWMLPPAAPEFEAPATGPAPQAEPDHDAWKCDRCNGDGWHYVEREGVEWRDIVRTKEHCEQCDGLGWLGPDAAKAALQAPGAAQGGQS